MAWQAQILFQEVSDFIGLGPNDHQLVCVKSDVSKADTHQPHLLLLRQPLKIGESCVKICADWPVIRVKMVEKRRAVKHRGAYQSESAKLTHGSEVR